MGDGRIVLALEEFEDPPATSAVRRGASAPDTPTAPHPGPAPWDTPTEPNPGPSAVDLAAASRPDRRSDDSGRSGAPPAGVAPLRLRSRAERS